MRWANSIKGREIRALKKILQRHWTAHRETASVAELIEDLGIEEFRAGNHLAAFAQFRNRLRRQSWIKRERNNPDAYSAMAAANYLMGQALVANGEAGAAGPKLHKATEMFGTWQRSPDES